MNMKINLGNNSNIEINRLNTVLLIGETGTGKSKIAEDIYAQLKAKFPPAELGFLILDMTRVEFLDWKNDPYLITPLIYKPQDAFEALETVIKDHNETKLTVIHIEECDMVIVDRERFEELWRKASELTNVLTVFSTSRPSKNVITPKVLEHTHLKIAFKLSTQEQSKYILGFEGAECLEEHDDKIITLKDKTLSLGSITRFKDVFITPDIKIETLPTDFWLDEENVLEIGDRLIGVFRGVAGTYVAKTLKKEFTGSFQREAKYMNIDKALKEVIDNKSTICLYEASERNGDLDSVKREGAMALIVYFSASGTAHFVQVGNIVMKRKSNNEFITITENHTFDNPKELEEIINRKLHGDYLGDYTLNDHINFMALKCFNIPDPDNLIGQGMLLPNIPSRFNCHVDYCGILNDQDTWLINTEPFTGSFQYEQATKSQPSL